MFFFFYFNLIIKKMFSIVLYKACALFTFQHCVFKITTKLRKMHENNKIIIII